MVKLKIRKFVDVLVEKGISKNEDKEIIVYGLCSGIEFVLNIITTIALGFIFGLVIESLVFLISFSLIRAYAGGYHCKKAINCYFFSSSIVILMLSILKFTPKRYILAISILMLFVCVPIILKLAPMETPTKPLEKVEKKYFRKKTRLHLGVECIVVILLFLFELYNISYVICLGILVTAGLVFLQMLNLKICVV